MNTWGKTRGCAQPHLEPPGTSQRASPHACALLSVSFSPDTTVVKTNNKQAAKSGMKPDVGTEMDLLKGFGFFVVGSFFLFFF